MRNRAANPQKWKDKAARYYVKNKPAIIERHKRWVAANKPRVNASNSAYRAVVSRAAPKWLTASDKRKIVEFYERAIAYGKKTGRPHQVDHMVPLRSKHVCGLHVPWNLQVMSAKANLAKRDKVLQSEHLAQLTLFAA